MYRSLSLFAVIFVACGGGVSDTKTTPPRVVKCITTTTSETIQKSFAGLSTPEMEANLAFKVAGQIISIPVITGEVVEPGNVMAQIDPRDLELIVAADRSSYEETKSSYERAMRLVSHEAISRQEAERAESAYSRSKSNYENSINLLDQTTLRAPFQAVVEKIMTQEYQRVQAGETIMRIVSPTTDQVSFTLPESMLSLLNDSLTRFSIQFDNYPQERFEAVVLESARSSSDASGFPVVLKFQNPSPTKYYINSGLSCSVIMRSRERDLGSVVLPISAIYAPTKGGTYVWIVDAKNQVKLRSVKLGTPIGVESVMVDEGVSGGEIVVVAGVYQLANNQKVKILE